MRASADEDSQGAADSPLGFQGIDSKDLRTFTLYSRGPAWLRFAALTFETTHWSLVVAAGGDDSSAARAALATLCETYWYPLYAYVRRWGASADDARDLTQGFLMSLLERRDFENLRQDRGRFRAFLLASLQHFLANDAARRRRRSAPASESYRVCRPIQRDRNEWSRFRVVDDSD
jgi:hypothetical protein